VPAEGQLDCQRGRRRLDLLCECCTVLLPRLRPAAGGSGCAVLVPQLAARGVGERRVMCFGGTGQIPISQAQPWAGGEGWDPSARFGMRTSCGHPWRCLAWITALGCPAECRWLWDSPHGVTHSRVFGISSLL